MKTIMSVLGASVLLLGAGMAHADEGAALPQPLFAQTVGGMDSGNLPKPDGPEAGDGDPGAGTDTPSVPSTGAEMSGKTVPDDSAGGAVHRGAGAETAPAKPKKDR